MSTTQAQFVELAWRYVEGDCEAAHVDAMAAMLRDDASLDDLFVELCLNRQTLAETIGRKGSVAAFLSEPEPVEPVLATVGPEATTRRWEVAAALAMAACVMIGVAMMVLSAWRGGEGGEQGGPVANRPAPVLAVLTRSDDVSWRRDPIDEGGEVTAGAVAIDGGRIEMELRSGVAVSLEGPAVLDLSDPMHGRLESGRMLAHVPPGAAGFTVESRGVRVIDLGTRFGIDAAPDGQTHVHVFTGRVRVEVGEESRELTAGQSLAVAGGSVALGTADPRRFGLTGPDRSLLRLSFGESDRARVRSTGVDVLRPGESLVHSGLTGRDGRLAFDGSGAGQAAFVDLDVSDSGSLSRAGLIDDDRLVGRDRKAVYVAWLMRGGFESTGWAGVSLFRGGDTDLRDEPLFIGKASDRSAVSYHALPEPERVIDGIAATAEVEPVAPTDRAVLIVLRVEYGEGFSHDRAAIWIDPDLSAAAPPKPNATFERPDLRFDRLRLGAGADAGAWSIDELRLADDWSALGDSPWTGSDDTEGDARD